MTHNSDYLVHNGGESMTDGMDSIHGIGSLSGHLLNTPQLCQTAPPTGYQVFKHRSLWRTFHIQTWPKLPQVLVISQPPRSEAATAVCPYEPYNSHRIYYVTNIPMVNGLNNECWFSSYAPELAKWFFGLARHLIAQLSNPKYLEWLVFLHISGPLQVPGRCYFVSLDKMLSVERIKSSLLEPRLVASTFFISWV